MAENQIIQMKSESRKKTLQKKSEQRNKGKKKAEPWAQYTDHKFYPVVEGIVDRGEDKATMQN
jgi:hypothetical protein